MPITGPASYLPTVDLFLAHWAEVDAALPVGLELKVGQPSAVAGAVPVLVGRAGMVTLRASLLAARINVTNTVQTLSIKREDLKDKKAALLARFNQFTAAVRSRYTGKAYERSLPLAPSVGDGMDVFTTPMQRADALWVNINSTLGATPLQIDQGVIPAIFYTEANFAAELTALRTASAAEQTEEQKLKMFLEKRNDLQDEIRPLLRDYRKAVEGRFSATHALVDSLPRFSPVGSTKPSAPSITSAAWNAATNVADVTFTPSSSTDVVRHELRVVPGTEYDPDLETVDAMLAVGQPPVFHSSSLLGNPGDVVSYRVYAINGDDQEADSGTAMVQRPV